MTCGPSSVVDGRCRSRRMHMGEPAWAEWMARESERVAVLERRAEEKRRLGEERALRERERAANRALRASALHPHATSERDVDAMTAVCRTCGPTTLKLKRHGSGAIKVCVNSGRGSRERNNRKATKPSRFRVSFCEACGLVPEHPSGLELDHVDGDYSNGSRSNLWTLCGTCHNIKTAYEQGRLVLSGRAPVVIVALARRLSPS